ELRQPDAAAIQLQLLQPLDDEIGRIANAQVGDPVLSFPDEVRVAVAFDDGCDLAVQREYDPTMHPDPADLAEVPRRGLLFWIAHARRHEASAVRLAHQLPHATPAAITPGQGEAWVIGKVQRHLVPPSFVKRYRQRGSPSTPVR